MPRGELVMRTRAIALALLLAATPAPGWAQFNLAAVLTNQPHQSTTPADVDGLILRVKPQTGYAFHFYVVVSANATTEAIQLSLRCPAAVLDIAYTVVSWTSATAINTTAQTACDSFPALTSSQGNVARVYEIFGRLVNGANAGHLAVRVRAETGGANTVTVQRGSWGLWHVRKP